MWPAGGHMYDVIVVGAGLAGLTAARRSQQLGAEVLVVEKGGDDDANATRRSGGAFHAATFDPRTHSADELYEAIMEATEGHARRDVARSWADNVLRSLHFLEAEGAVFERTGADEAHWNRTGPAPRVTEEIDKREPNWRGGANDRLLKGMAAAFSREGGNIKPRTSAVALHSEDGRITGVYIQPTGGGERELMRAATVVMADGGFVGNSTLMEKYVTRHVYVSRCGDLATGDCLGMAIEVGAKVVEMDAAYQMVALRDRATNPQLAHPPSPTWLINAAIVVNGNGERMGDEALETPPSSQGAAAYPSNQYADKRLCGQMTRTDAPADSWVIFDDETWETAGRKTSEEKEDPLHGGMTRKSGVLAKAPMNPTILDHGGEFLSAATIEDLARQAGLPHDRLQRTVDAFNQFCISGTPLYPPRSKRARPITATPFHAVPVIPGVFFTMGGILVNGQGQVLNGQGRPIEGLYAAGGTMGGLMGGPHDGYAGGWSQASTFGLLAAEHAVLHAAGVEESGITASRRERERPGGVQRLG